MSEEQQPAKNRSDPSTPLPVQHNPFFPSVRKETMDSIVPHLSGKSFSYAPTEHAATDPLEEVGRVSEEKRVHFMLEGGIMAAWTKTVVQVMLLKVGAKEAMDRLPVKDEDSRKALLTIIFEKFKKLSGELQLCPIPVEKVTYNATSGALSATNTYTFRSDKNEVQCAQSEHPETMRFMEETTYRSMNCASRNHYVRVLILAALCGAINLDKKLSITSMVQSSDELADSIIGGMDEKAGP